MNKAELEKKPLSELHLLAAEAGVSKYRMLSKRELVDRLAGENGGQPAAKPAKAEKREERRRRRFGRRGKQGVTLQGLLLPPEAGRQALLCADSREACTALLRGVAADLAADSKGPDPVALLID